MLVMPYSLLFEIYGEWKFGWIFCYFWISCDVTCCTASILHLCVISLDRYLAITGPFTYKTRMSKHRAVFIICLVWLTSGAISFVPIFLGWYADKTTVDLYIDSPECGLYVNKIYAVISSGMSFYLPLVIMIIVYLKIFRIAQAQAEAISKLEVQCQPQEYRNTHEEHNGQAASSHINLKNRSRKVSRDFKAIRTLGKATL